MVKELSKDIPPATYAPGRPAVAPSERKVTKAYRFSPWVIRVMKKRGLRLGPEFENCVIAMHKLKRSEDVLS